MRRLVNADWARAFAKNFVDKTHDSLRSCFDQDRVQWLASMDSRATQAASAGDQRSLHKLMRELGAYSTKPLPSIVLEDGSVATDTRAARPR